MRFKGKWDLYCCYRTWEVGRTDCSVEGIKREFWESETAFCCLRIGAWLTGTLIYWVKCFIMKRKRWKVLLQRLLSLSDWRSECDRNTRTWQTDWQSPCRGRFPPSDCYTVDTWPVLDSLCYATAALYFGPSLENTKFHAQHPTLTSVAACELHKCR